MFEDHSASSSSPESGAPARRRILHSAAWSVPVIALATAAPVASASGPPQTLVPNSLANYYWDTAADTTFVRLDPASGEHAVTFSAQISYRADP
ncbi:hypothetical protein [Brevibacterium album]|uniref:hypothetical protein n=1 Tax=Brevibacterium album TaxID=417948 RepID=UPI00040F5D1B|nr:hypothetical protein [Brevibacterium album]